MGTSSWEYYFPFVDGYVAKLVEAATYLEVSGVFAVRELKRRKKGQSATDYFWAWVPPSGAVDPFWSLTPTSQGVEPIVYLSTQNWTVADYDERPYPRVPARYGRPVAVVPTDRGRQVVWPGAGLPPDGGDALHVGVSYLRGWFGLRVRGVAGPRALTQGWRGRAPVGYRQTFELLRAVWREAQDATRCANSIPTRAGLGAANRRLP